MSIRIRGALERGGLMSFVRSRPRRLVAWLLPLSLVAMSGVAHAAPVLNVSGGKLTGASGVEVLGSLYDVSFRDGSCDSLYDRCNSQLFVAASQDEALALRLALMEQVFVDSPAGNFDSNPELTEGCTRLVRCVALTPYAVDKSVDPWRVFTVGTWNYDSLDTQGGLIDEPRTYDTGRDHIADATTWAVWQRTGPTQTVPEPGTLALVGAAGLGLAGLRRRQRALAKTRNVVA